MVRWIIALSLGLVLCACGENKPAKEEIKEEIATNNQVDKNKFDLIDLSPFGISAQINVPNKKTTNAEPEVFYNDASGVVKVSSGNKFRLNISETEMDKSIVISDLQDDLLFENTVLIEEENFIKYNSKLPDGSQESTHFCVWVDIDGATYLIENDKSESFSEHYLNRMIQAVKSIQFNNSI